MRTLNQGIAAFLQQGIRPRIFVRVFDSTGVDLLLQGTKEVGEYEDRMTTFGSINQSIRPEGGMAEVSGAEVNRLVLDERLTLCTEASLDPQFQNGIRGAGRILSASLNYTAGRNAVTGSLGSPAVVVGRNYSSGSFIYTMARGFLQFEVPAALTTCEDAYIKLTGIGDYSTDDFTIYGLAGTWTDLAAGGAILNDFTGWAASGDYTVSANWIESWTTVEYGTIVYLRLNALGRAAVVAAAGTADKIFRIMLISNRDSNFTGYPTGPAGTEFVQFEAETARLELRYNSKTLDNQPIEILYGLETLPATISGATLDRVWTGVVDSWSLNDRELTLTAKQNDHKKNRIIPSGLLNLTDYPNCPAENIGKAIPVVYGDFLSPISHKQGIPYVANEDNESIIYSHKDYVKAYVYHDSSNYLILAGHAIKQIDNLLAGYESNLGAYMFYAGDVTAIGGSSNAKISIATNTAAKFPYKITLNSISPIIGFIPENFLPETGVDNPERMTDADVTNYAIFEANDYYEFILADNALWDAFPSLVNGNVFVNRYLCFYTIADAGYDGFKISIIKNLNGAYHATQNVNITTDGWHFVNIGDADIANSVLDYQFTLSNIGGTKTIKVYNLSCCVGIQETIKTSAFIACKGRPDDGSGTVTGTPAALIENPAHVIESIARSEIGLLAAEIDTAAFDDVYTGMSILTADGTFAVSTGWTAGTGWVIGNGYADHATTASGTLSGASTATSTAKYYTVRFTVTVTTPGTGFTVSLGSTDSGATYNTAGTYTVDIQPSDGTGTLLFTPGVGGTFVGTIDDVTITEMKLAFQLLDRKSTRELLDDMAALSRLLLWWVEQDRLTCKRIDSADGFPHSATDVPGDLDIFTVTGDPVAGAFTTHPIFEGPKIRLMDMADVKNDFVVKYKKNYATGDYGAVLTCNKDGETLDDTMLSGVTGAELVTLCDDCYDRILTVNTLEIEAWAIRDEATATALIQHLIQWFAKRRYIIEFTAGVSAIEKELGDFINVRDDRIEDLFGTAVMNIKKWMCTQINPQLNNSIYRIEAIEVD